MKLKKGCAVGCLLLFSGLVVLMGAATWYSREINREYKAVQRTEKALVAATAEPAFSPPDPPSLSADRLAAFLAVRDSLAGPRQDLEAAAAEFSREKQRSRGRGWRGWLDLIGTGSDLAPVYATYWSTRNRALLAQGMGPAEYIWTYSLVYYHWLGRDPEVGREPGLKTGVVQAQITGELTPDTVDRLAPLRLRLESGFSEQLNPIELIFGDEPDAGTR